MESAAGWVRRALDERPGLAMGGVMLFALALRSANNTTDFFSFWYDEAEYSWRALYILEHGGAYPMERLGDHPPLLPYLLAGVFSLTGPAWWAARGFSAGLGALAVLVVYLAGREWRGHRAGLAAAFLMAVTPLAVYVSREVVLENALVLALSLALLAIARIERRGAQTTSLALLAAAAWMAFASKATALVLIPAAVWFAVRAGLHREPRAWIAAAVAAALALPIYLLMAAHGFLTFHGDKVSSAATYNVGDTLIRMPHGASLFALLLLANVLLVPAVIAGWRAARAGDRVGEACVALVLATVGLLLLITNYAPHYAATALPALALLAGAQLADRPRWLATVGGALATVSVAGIFALFALTSLGDAQDVVLARAQPGDAVLSTDAPVFAFARPGELALFPSAENLSREPRFLVLNARDRNLLHEEPAFAGYALIHVAPPARWEATYYVYERGLGS